MGRRGSHCGQRQALISAPPARSCRIGSGTSRAFYPTQYIFDRGYGNYLGLCHLGSYIAHQAALQFTSLHCYIGSDTRDATEGLVTLGQRVTEAMTGAGLVAKEMFAGLGVSASDFVGFDAAEQFYKLHATLLAVQDPAKRVQLLFNAVGEDTGKNLIGTLSMTTAELRKNAAGFAITSDRSWSADYRN